MAIGLTAPGGSDREYSGWPVPTDPARTRQREERMARLLPPALQEQPASSPPATLPPSEASRRKAKPMPKAAEGLLLFSETTKNCDKTASDPSGPAAA